MPSVYACLRKSVTEGQRIADSGQTVNIQYRVAVQASTLQKQMTYQNMKFNLSEQEYMYKPQLNFFLTHMRLIQIYHLYNSPVQPCDL